MTCLSMPRLQTSPSLSPSSQDRREISFASLHSQQGALRAGETGSLVHTASRRSSELEPQLTWLQACLLCSLTDLNILATALDVWDLYLSPHRILLLLTKIRTGCTWQTFPLPFSGEARLHW